MGRLCGPLRLPAGSEVAYDPPGEGISGELESLNPRPLRFVM
jgi:hypothetical protein